MDAGMVLNSRNRQEENDEICGRQDKRALGRERERQDGQREGNGGGGEELSCAWKNVDGQPGFSWVGSNRAQVLK